MRCAAVRAVAQRHNGRALNPERLKPSGKPRAATAIKWMVGGGGGDSPGELPFWRHVALPARAHALQLCELLVVPAVVC